MKKKHLKYFLLLLVIIGSFIVFNLYSKIYKANTKKKGFVYVKTDATMEELKNEIAPFLDNINSFNWVASVKKFKKPKSGKYLITSNMSNNTLINKLRSGNQTPVKLSFNNQNTLASLAGRISQQIEADSISLIKAFKDTNYLKKIKFTEPEILGMFIPNSYQILWNTSAKKFRDKMHTEYIKFWNNKRIEKAKKLNLTPKEVMTLASIVHKETTRKSERPIVAGLYLNRLKNKYRFPYLEADPTVIFAMKQKYGQDKVIKRVLFKNIEETKNSPYNTYKHQGLPPSPIAMPDITAIDGVLNRTNHDYYFMCASVTKIGYHEFAKTLGQHNKNRAKFIAKKNRQGIRQ